MSDGRSVVVNSASTAHDVVVAETDFERFKISPTPTGDYYYFLDPSGFLKKYFVLEQRTRVETICTVALVVLDDGRFSPRIHVWKQDRSKTSVTEARHAIEESRESNDLPLVKASVGLGKEGTKNFLKLVKFLQGFENIVVTEGEVGQPLSVVGGDSLQLVRALEGKGREEQIGIVEQVLSGGLTYAEAVRLTNRKAGLEEFGKKLDSDKDVKLSEPKWQEFFEENPWIFGFGMRLIVVDKLIDQKLEQTVTGNNAFTGAGKRVDAIMVATGKGILHSLLFVEIKRACTPILRSSQYRAPDVWGPSDELTGATSQVQKDRSQGNKKGGGHVYPDCYE